MTIQFNELKNTLEGRKLPGGSIVIEPYESSIGDAAWRSRPTDDGTAHPVWFIIASLRCMGISVDELCALAHQAPGDTLMLGNCSVEQNRPLHVSEQYVADASIAGVRTRTTRDGSRLDSIDVVVRFTSPLDEKVGAVTSEYMFKREAS